MDQPQPVLENVLLINEEALEYSHFLSRQRAQKEKEDLKKQKEIEELFRSKKSEIVRSADDDDEVVENIPQKRRKLSDNEELGFNGF